jgi:hypothetical protein
MHRRRREADAVFVVLDFGWNAYKHGESPCCWCGSCNCCYCSCRECGLESTSATEVADVV